VLRGSYPSCGRADLGPGLGAGREPRRPQQLLGVAGRSGLGTYSRRHACSEDRGLRAPAPPAPVQGPRL